MQSFEYFYKNEDLTKLIYSDIYSEKILFYQYQNGLPTQIMHISPDKELLSTSQIFSDSLQRPYLLKNFDVNQIPQFTQTIFYQENSNKFLLQQHYLEHPHLKGRKTTFEYYPCSEDIYLSTINKEQFEKVGTKILNLLVEKNKATVVKGVLNDQGKEEIFVQEIEFDEFDNWIQSNLYRLKKRKQKKILVQAIERNIVYR